MDSAPLLSPSDKQLLGSLDDRVDAILDARKLNHPISWPFSSCGAESEPGKQFREDSFLLIRGLDSIFSSLSQLTDTLAAAQQGLNDIAKPSIRKAHKREIQRTEDEDEEREAKKHCRPNDVQEQEELDGSNKNCGFDSKEEDASGVFQEYHEDEQISYDVANSGNLKKAKKLAMLMTTKSASLARELKIIRSELSFMQERCTMLEEENRRLVEGFEKGAAPEEDDLVRLQLEALLTEKSRLANENANLMRENQCLHQLVEYHQLTSQDISSSYEEFVGVGAHLDFSSPTGKAESESDDCENHHLHGNAEGPNTPSTTMDCTSAPGRKNHREQHLGNSVKRMIKELLEVAEVTPA